MEKKLAEENKLLREAGDSLALAAAKVASEFDGVHRLRAALAKWYDLRAGVYGSGMDSPREVTV